MISYPTFRALLSDVPNCPDFETYAAECGGSVTVDDAAEALRILTAVWTMGQSGLSIKSIAAACEMPVRRIALTLDLPVRTVEDWSSGVRNPSPWQFPLIAYAVLSVYIGE